MSVYDIFLESKITSISEFADFFSKSSKEAFRLELLQKFEVEGETEVFKKYLEKKEKPDSFNSDWHEMIDNAIKRGCKYRRVRYIQTPPSEYLKFEIDWGYKGNVKKGEEIYYTTDLPSNNIPILKDFWLFDDKTLFFMEYDYIGRFLGVSKLSEAHIPAYIKLKNQLLDKCDLIENSEYW